MSCLFVFTFWWLQRAVVINSEPHFFLLVSPWFSVWLNMSHIPGSHIINTSLSVGHKKIKT